MSQDLITENQQLRSQLAQLFEQAEQNQQILQRHQSFDLKLIAAGSFKELLDTIFHGFAKAAGLDIVALTLLDPEYQIRRILFDLNINITELQNLAFLQNESEFGDLLPTLSTPLLGQYHKPLHGMFFPEMDPPPESIAVVPLLRQHRLIGAISFGSSDPTRFTSGMATDFISHLGSIIAICLENVINNERLKHIGLTDPLTAVNNRRYVERRLIEEIGRSRRQGYALSCMYIDIDHFKQINDCVGHQAGDEVLRSVAERIKAELRLSDALGRFGGEEFVVLLIDAELAAAITVAERIRKSIGDHPVILTNGEKFHVTVSIGVASLTENAAEETVESIAHSFIARADQALYRAKNGGRNLVAADE